MNSKNSTYWKPLEEVEDLEGIQVVLPMKLVSVHDGTHCSEVDWAEYHYHLLDDGEEVGVAQMVVPYQGFQDDWLKYLELGVYLTCPG